MDTRTHKNITRTRTRTRTRTQTHARARAHTHTHTHVTILLLAPFHEVASVVPEVILFKALVEGNAVACLDAARVRAYMYVCAYACVCVWLCDVMCDSV